MDTGFLSAFARTAGALVLVLGLMICLFSLIRRWRFRSSSLRAYPEMRLIGSVHLAPKRAVALVELCDEWLVVGVGTESVTLLTKMERPLETGATDAVGSGNEKVFHSLLQAAGIWGRGRETAGGKHEGT